MAETTPSTENSTNTSELDCDIKIAFYDDEFSVLENNTLLLENGDDKYLLTEYQLFDGGAFICLPETSDEDTLKFSPALGWVTVVGLGLSCVCLTLHLITFLLVTHLRNLPGKNLACLCLSLLAAYITFMCSTYAQPNTTLCYAQAAAIYYTFLASFCWMNVLAFDNWHALKKLRLSFEKHSSVFLKYTLYGWLVPALALALVVALDRTAPLGFPTEFLPHLGQHLCWFGQRKALLVFFVAPFTVMSLLNVLFFVLTVTIIRKTRNTVRQVTSRPQNEALEQLKIYVRLEVVIGLTWTSGIVAGTLESEVAWYIFVVFNTLQGTFIFLAFTCRRHVWEALSERFHCGKSSSGTNPGTSTVSLEGRV